MEISERTVCSRLGTTQVFAKLPSLVSVIAGLDVLV
jgi:hypothetical protein